MFRRLALRDIFTVIKCNLLSGNLWLRFIFDTVSSSICKVILLVSTWLWHTIMIWWRHQMETFSTLLVLCYGNSLVTGEFPSRGPVTRSFDVFLDLHLNKWFNKLSRRRWSETPPRSLWRHSNVMEHCHSVSSGLVACVNIIHCVSHIDSYVMLNSNAYDNQLQSHSNE